MSNQYVVQDYIDTTDFGLYFVGDVTTVRGGSIRWQDCGTWENWPNSRWSPGVGPAPLTLSASTTAGVKFGGKATPSLTLSANVLSAVMQLPFPHTTFVVDSETRAYTLPFEPDFRFFAIENGETRVYPVIHETRTTVIESETREQPTEVY